MQGMQQRGACGGIAIWPVRWKDLRCIDAKHEATAYGFSSASEGKSLSLLDR
jgi:hypothetical protein